MSNSCVDKKGIKRITNRICKESRKKWRLTIRLLVRVVICGLLTCLLSFLFAVLIIKLIDFKYVEMRGFALAVFWFTLCMIFSNLIVFKMMKRTIIIVEDISQATKKVAKGDFSVRLVNEKAGEAEIIDDLYEDFNHMVKELGTIETLQNGFVADVSHEFKTPISAIEGYAMLLQDETLSEDEKKEYLNNIIYNSKRLSTLTGNVLMLSKLENAVIKINNQKFSLDEQIRRIILNFEEQWSKKNLELDIDLDQVNYYGDEDLLYHVWLNLISNAIKFSNDDGLLKIKLVNNKYNIVFTIEDSGVGMTEETKKRIFEKFYQNDSSRAEEGNGLGLSLVKRILDICSGKIDVETELGKGTRFTVTLDIV